MTLEQIQNLTINDFETRNSEVWNAIRNLEIKDLILLWRKGFNHFDWNDDVEIKDGFFEILQSRVSEYIKETVIDKLSDEQKAMMAFLFFEKDGTWDTLRSWDLVEGYL